MSESNWQLISIGCLIFLCSIGLAGLGLVSYLVLRIILKHLVAFAFLALAVSLVGSFLLVYAPAMNVKMVAKRQQAVEQAYLALTPTATPTITPTPMPTLTPVPVATTEAASTVVWETPEEESGWRKILGLSTNSPWLIILVISGIVLLAVVLALLFFRPRPNEEVQS